MPVKEASSHRSHTGCVQLDSHETDPIAADSTPYRSTRYSNFTPLEASIVFHFAGMGLGDTRLAWKDFGQLFSSTCES